MNINVSSIKAAYDALDLGDNRRFVPIGPIPVFMTMRLDRTRLRPTNSINGREGRASRGSTPIVRMNRGARNPAPFAETTTLKTSEPSVVESYSEPIVSITATRHNCTRTAPGNRWRRPASLRRPSIKRAQPYVKRVNLRS